MTVMSLAAFVVEPPDQGPLWTSWIAGHPLQLTFLRLANEDGVTGAAVSWLPDSTRGAVDALDELYAPMVLGASEFSREAIWQRVGNLTYFTGLGRVWSMIDCALWDLASRSAGLPLWRFMGGYRDEIPCYGSAPPVASTSEAIRLAEACMDRGMRAFKLHGTGDIQRDTPVVRELRSALGADVAIMYDGMNALTVGDAVAIGHVLDELGYEWFEAPLVDDDLGGYARVAAAVDIPVLNGEVFVRSYRQIGAMLAAGAIDIGRLAGDVSGGITALNRCGALCAGLGARLEPRCYGPTLVQAMHLAWLLSVPGGRYFEVPLDAPELEAGMHHGVELRQGHACGTDRPGLGVEVDWSWVERHAVHSCRREIPERGAT